MVFDPLDYLPQNLQPTESRLFAIMGFYEANGRPPTISEAIALCGSPVDHGTTTDPLPDGYAGRDWRNPHWLQRLRNGG